MTKPQGDRSQAPEPKESAPHKIPAVQPGMESGEDARRAQLEGAARGVPKDDKTKRPVTT